MDGKNGGKAVGGRNEGSVEEVRIEGKEGK